MELYGRGLGRDNVQIYLLSELSVHVYVNIFMSSPQFVKHRKKLQVTTDLV